jgi:hypothetical protein
MKTRWSAGTFAAIVLALAVVAIIYYSVRTTAVMHHPNDSSGIERQHEQPGQQE